MNIPGKFLVSMMLQTDSKVFHWVLGLYENFDIKFFWYVFLCGQLTHIINIINFSKILKPTAQSMIRKI